MKTAAHHDLSRAPRRGARPSHREKLMRHGGWILATCLTLAGLGCAPRPDAASPADTAAHAGGSQGNGGVTGAAEGAVVSVELRGQEQLVFEGGARIRIERFVVNLGGVSLVRDLADPAGSNVRVPGGALPVVGAEGEAASEAIVIGRDEFAGGAFEGLRLDLTPPEVPAATDPGASTLLVEGRFLLPSDPSARKDDAKISPNPAPIVPAQGQSTQSLSSSYALRFTFRSRLSEGLLVGLGQDFDLGDSVTLTFAARGWFTADVVSYLEAEALARLRLGIADASPLLLGGSGVPVTDAEAEAVGAQLEENIVESIGFELR